MRSRLWTSDALVITKLLGCDAPSTTQPQQLAAPAFRELLEAKSLRHFGSQCPAHPPVNRIPQPITEGGIRRQPGASRALWALWASGLRPQCRTFPGLADPSLKPSPFEDRPACLSLCLQLLACSSTSGHPFCLGRTRPQANLHEAYTTSIRISQALVRSRHPPFRPPRRQLLEFRADQHGRLSRRCTTSILRAFSSTSVPFFYRRTVAVDESENCLGTGQEGGKNPISPRSLVSPLVRRDTSNQRSAITSQPRRKRKSPSQSVESGYEGGTVSSGKSSWGRRGLGFRNAHVQQPRSTTSGRGT
ncbi:hypothetical protein B0T24DRAFT_145806 [Lasiosphaeria ovina]|uniref:Uncharacterized protein n=1 Tax=Lasiosphaeria ovina TaxID=92902 RepID=A0AAE0ND64_9PEZI|nr:hypothetical protein B0T24DRAFT_145806 [Lasiosphaeria ovina]